MRALFPAFVLMFLLAGWAGAEGIGDYLLPNGEPIVGVYYYSWYGGEPYRAVGWTPEFQYDNRNNDAHIREVIKAMTDYGINQASFSYWDNSGYFNLLDKHLRQARDLAAQGRECYFSPYLEPNTVNKVFADPDAQRENIDFISTYTKAFGAHPLFCRLGDVPFTNIYVAYYIPDETDEDFRTFLQDKYGSIDALRRAWAGPEGYTDQGIPEADLPMNFGAVRLRSAIPGTIAFADRQALRARRLKEGWGEVISGVKDRTGMDSRYTGDVSSTSVSPVDYMQSLTGMSWYSFAYPLNNPTRRPKLISEVAKFTDTTFLYTIAPGYVDRQQRWPGARVEREPYLYPYAWVKAIQALPEGVMILTHSEWFEGSIIDVTKEYGRQQYEDTELYSSVFRAAFESIYNEKRDREPVAIVFNEWTNYSLHDNGPEMRDVSGLIKLLECLNVEYDVIPESSLSTEELAGRKLVLVPNCGISLAPGHNELLLDWARNTPGARLIVDESRWWADALGIELGEGRAPILRYRCDNVGKWISPLSERAYGLRVANAGVCTRIGETEGETPKILGRTYEDDGRGVIFFNGRLGAEFEAAFNAAASQGRVPVLECGALLDLLRSGGPEFERLLPDPPSSDFEIKAGPVLRAKDTLILPAGNVLPWGAITNHREVGGGLDSGHSAEETMPWQRGRCSFSVTVDPGAPVAQVYAIDSDSGRFVDLAFHREGDSVSFDMPLKFHGLFAVAQSPIKLITPPITLQPGQNAKVTVEAVNVTGERTEAVLSLRKTPGLSMEPVRFAVPALATAKVPITLDVGTDYASGERTVSFELEAGGRTAVLWRGLHVDLPACIGTRTTILGGKAGEKVTRRVTLVNVGETPAQGLQVTLEDGQVGVPDLAPGAEASVDLTFTIPRSARAGKAPKSPVELVLGAGKQERGLSTKSTADGQTQDLELAGRGATQPIPGIKDAGASNQMIYLFADDAALPPGDYDLEAVVDYFDRGTGRFMIEYDSTSGDSIEDRYRDSAPVSLTDSGQWRTATLALPGARLAGRQNAGADLRINGIVPVGRIILRGLTQTSQTVQRKMTVAYTQHGHPMKQDLDITLVAFEGDVPEEAQLNPFGNHVAGYLNGPAPARDSALKTTDLVASQGLLVVDTPYLSAVWDKTRGGLVSLTSKQTRTDYAAFPGPMVPVLTQLADGDPEYFAPGDLVTEGNRIAARGTTGPGDVLDVQDTWTVAPDQPKVTLQRYIAPRQSVELAEFAPAVLRLNPEPFDQVLPLGVGFRDEAQPGRGWLETWHSDGWYFAYSGAPESARHGLAMTVRAEKIAGRSGLRRFRYGFFPADGLPAPEPGGVASDELQVRLRGNLKLEPTDRIQITIDLYLLPGGSWRAARELALINANPTELASNTTVTGGDWSRAGGPQTAVPAAPLYMFPVRQPYPSAALEGDR
ncbi:MAG: hypothetical protein HPY44_16760 [Armatimonadetes bacterium]|nr:hypothetical protein [Armatimonadota bacterium]